MVAVVWWLDYNGSGGIMNVVEVVSTLVVVVGQLILSPPHIENMVSQLML